MIRPWAARIDSAMGNDWKEKEAKLLQEIEAFARTNPDLAAINAAEKGAPKKPASPQPAAAEKPAATAPAPQKTSAPAFRRR